MAAEGTAVSISGKLMTFDFAACTGYAIGAPDGAPTFAHHVFDSTGADLGEHLGAIEDWLSHIIRTERPGMVGYEQPLSGRASFVADWFSGHNGFGYVTPGFSFALPHNGLLNIGYSIGNEGRKNNALFVYYGVTF